MSCVELAHEKTSTSTHPARLESLDLAKLVSAIAVIWIHACHSQALEQLTHVARFAVPFFAAAAGFGLVRSKRIAQSSFLQFTCQRFARLYVPFLVWSIAYLLFKVIKRVLLPNQECDLPGLEFFVLGGAYHLWFIPFLITASLIIYPFIIVSHQRSKLSLGLTIVFAFIGLWAGWVAPMDDGSGHFFILIAQAIPGLLWGCSFGWLFRSYHQLQINRGLLWTLMAISLILLAIGPRVTYLENIAGVLMLLLAIDARDTDTRSSSHTRKSNVISWLSPVSQVAMGIYFAHLLILKVGDSIVAKMRIADSTSINLAQFAIACAASIAIARVLAGWKSTRWLVA